MSVHPYVSTYMNLKTTNIHNWCLYVIDATDNNDNNNDRYVCISVIFASSSILIIALCIFSCHSSRAKKIHNQPIRLPRHKVVHVHKQKRKPTVPMAESIRFRSNHREIKKCWADTVSLSCPIYLLNFWSIAMQSRSLIVERPLL